jgi:hypothetical protein
MRYPCHLPLLNIAIDIQTLNPVPAGNPAQAAVWNSDYTCCGSGHPDRPAIMHDFPLPDIPPPAEQEGEQYRFVRDRQKLKIFVRQSLYALTAVTLLFGILPSFAFLYILDAEQFAKTWLDLITAPPIWSIILIGMIFIVEIFFYFWKQSIVINKNGIAFHNFIFGHMEEFYEWQELAQIHRAILPNRSRKSGSHGKNVLVFTDKYGKIFLLPASTEAHPAPRNVFHFVGYQHQLSVLETIEKFYGAVELSNEDAQQKTPLLSGIRWNTCIKGRSGHVAITSLIIATVAAYLSNTIATGFLPLTVWNNNICIIIYWITGGCSIRLAWQYLQHGKSRESALMLSALFAASIIFLMLPTTTLLPVWFGTAQQDTFFLAKYNTNKNQYWRSVSAPRSVYFTLRLDRENRKYNQPGTEHEFTVYHSVFGLKSINMKEIEAMQQP